MSISIAAGPNVKNVSMTLIDIPVVYGDLSGTVVDQDGKPLSDVTVMLGSTPATTNVSGMYYFINIPPGLYQLSFTKTGYQSVTI